MQYPNGDTMFHVVLVTTTILEMASAQPRSPRVSPFIQPFRSLSTFYRSGYAGSAASKCQADGDKYVHWQDCKSYFSCQMSRGQWRAIPINCHPAGTAFDDTLKQCVDLFGWCPNEPCTYPYIDQCQAHNDKHVTPEDCSQYFRCHMHSNGLFYSEQLQCGRSQMFDDLQKQCVDGECPQDLIPLPSGDGWHCDIVGEFNVLPTDCSKFYKCLRCSKNPHGWCYLVLSCEPGCNYDDTSKSCIKGPCPSDLIELPGGPGWVCNGQGDINVNPENCGQFYECIRCIKPRGWCYRGVQNCPNGELFDNAAKRCVDTDTCPQDFTPVPPGGNIICKGIDGERRVHPDNCNQFYTCLACSLGNGWCYTVDDCPSGQNFDDSIGECVYGVCPQILKPLPPSFEGKCDGKEGRYVGFKKMCNKYIQCHKCSINDGGYCYIKYKCPDGENFDEDSQRCVTGPCPSDLMELPRGWHCSRNGEINVHPSDCSMWYICTECSKPSGWCAMIEQCPDGQLFNEATGTCGDYDWCPQNPPPPPPPTWGPPPPPTWAPPPPPPPPEPFKCTRLLDFSKYPHDEYCNGFWKCTCLFLCLKFESWCRPGEYFHRDTRRCLWGQCPYGLPDYNKNRW